MAPPTPRGPGTDELARRCRCYEKGQIESLGPLDKKLFFMVRKLIHPDQTLTKEEEKRFDFSSPDADEVIPFGIMLNWRPIKKLEKRIAMSKNSAKMLLEKRAKYGLPTNTIPPKYLLQNWDFPLSLNYVERNWKVLVYGRDGDGHFNIWDTSGNMPAAFRQRLGKLPRDEQARLMWEYHSFAIENVFRARQKYAEEMNFRVTKHNYILHAGQASLKTVREFRKVVQDALVDYQEVWPESVKTVYVVEASFMFRALWKVMKRFVDPITAKKVKVLGSKWRETLAKDGITEIPTAFGGTGDGSDEINRYCNLYPPSEKEETPEDSLPTTGNTETQGVGDQKLLPSAQEERKSEASVSPPDGGPLPAPTRTPPVVAQPSPPNSGVPTPRSLEVPSPRSTVVPVAPPVASLPPAPEAALPEVPLPLPPAPRPTTPDAAAAALAQAGRSSSEALGPVQQPSGSGGDEGPDATRRSRPNSTSLHFRTPAQDAGPPSEPSEAEGLPNRPRPVRVVREQGPDDLHPAGPESYPEPVPPAPATPVANGLSQSQYLYTGPPAAASAGGAGLRRVSTPGGSEAGYPLYAGRTGRLPGEFTPTPHSEQFPVQSLPTGLAYSPPPTTTGHAGSGGVVAGLGSSGGEENGKSAATREMLALLRARLMDNDRSFSEPTGPPPTIQWSFERFDYSVPTNGETPSSRNHDAPPTPPSGDSARSSEVDTSSSVAETFNEEGFQEKEEEAQSRSSIADIGTGGPRNSPGTDASANGGAPTTPAETDAGQQLGVHGRISQESNDEKFQIEDNPNKIKRRWKRSSSRSHSMKWGSQGVFEFDQEVTREKREGARTSSTEVLL